MPGAAGENQFGQSSVLLGSSPWNGVAQLAPVAGTQ